jgi:hypothetical protein
MPDLLAGTKLLANDTPPTLDDEEPDSFTFTTTTYGVGTTGGTYNDCGRAFIAPTSGRVLLCYNARIVNSGANGTFIAPVVRLGSTVGSGAVFLAASDAFSILTVLTSSQRQGCTKMVDGLTPGDSYNVRLEHRVDAGTGTALARDIAILACP